MICQYVTVCITIYVQTHNLLCSYPPKVYFGFNKNAQCYFRCLIVFQFQENLMTYLLQQTCCRMAFKKHCFRLTDNGAMSLEPQLLSFSSILSNHSMRAAAQPSFVSVEAVWVSCVWWEHLGNNNMDNWWVKIQWKKVDKYNVHLISFV